jgi:hypothetical protein
VEEYEERHTRQVANGKDKDGNTTYREEVYYTTEHDTHYEHWTVHRDFGAHTDEVRIEESLYNEIYHKFGGKINRTAIQSTSHIGGSYDGGDRNIYITENNTGYIYPVTTIQTCENRIKAAPSVFSFAEVPTNINVYPWPKNPDWMRSDRLCGTASILINTYKWDCLNTRLGSLKRVNLIMVGFPPGNPSDMGQWQQAKWIGGKKNDLVLCFGGATHGKNAEWAYVFGWTEKELVKRNLESILIGNPMNDNILPLIAEEVNKNYVIKDWHKFDYITIEPPAWSYWLYFMLMVLIQGGLFWYFHVNEYDKESAGKYNPYRRGIRY